MQVYWYASIASACCQRCCCCYPRYWLLFKQCVKVRMLVNWCASLWGTCTSLHLLCSCCSRCRCSDRPGFESWLRRDFFSLMLSWWTELRLNPSSAKQLISQTQLSVKSRAQKYLEMLQLWDTYISVIASTRYFVVVALVVAVVINDIGCYLSSWKHVFRSGHVTKYWAAAPRSFSST